MLLALLASAPQAVLVSLWRARLLTTGPLSLAETVGTSISAALTGEAVKGCGGRGYGQGDSRRSDDQDGDEMFRLFVAMIPHVTKGLRRDPDDTDGAELFPALAETLAPCAVPDVGLAAADLAFLPSTATLHSTWGRQHPKAIFRALNPPPLSPHKNTQTNE